MKALVFSGILATGVAALGQKPQQKAMSADAKAPFFRRE
jgi:hypothetical protein